MSSMLGPDEKPDGLIRVHFQDNTYKTLSLKNESPVEEVVQWLCKRISATGRRADPSRHELFIIAPGNQSLRERRLLREDRPLEIQAKGGATAFKFLFREVLLPEAGGEKSSLPGSDGDTPVPVASDSRGQLRQGQLELQDGATWHVCTVILDECHLWYSQARSSEAAAVGGGMACLPLRSCDRALESEDKQVLKLLTKEGEMSFRARTSSERNSWLLAIVKQAAVIKEQDILAQAERAISSVESRRTGTQLKLLESFTSLEGLLSDDGEARELFLWFLKSEEKLASSMDWPEGLSSEALLAQLESSMRAEDDQADSQAAEARAFADKVLLPRFHGHPGVQSRLCRIAAGVT
eukprot:TRINITY_DN77877_c0_g1_i1.p1 TRINITY_DN77877_c0_g1~~TRINITY_DN77877_c0_g1_i1.p1  ORF type:complete len:359 (-),score=91.42 TRINITY_DN77877_c0_g1_i1:3-1058(-)